MTGVGGITFADYYPYDLEAPATCDKAKNDFTVTVTSWHEMDGLNDNEQQMIDYVLSKGTLAVAVDASLWHSYRGGIFSSCTGKPINFNHGVNIVGVNTKERYWIIRNSWGTWWGENGYMRLAMVSARIIAFETVWETFCFTTMLCHFNSSTSPLPLKLGQQSVRGCILGWLYENSCCQTLFTLYT